MKEILAALFFGLLAITAMLSVVALVATLGIGAVLFNAYALTVLWAWFVTPIVGFTITIPMAIGFGLVLSLLHPSWHRISAAKVHRVYLEPKPPGWCNAVSLGLLYLMPAWALGVGWIALQFMG